MPSTPVWGVTTTRKEKINKSNKSTLQDIYIKKSLVIFVSEYLGGGGIFLMVLWSSFLSEEVQLLYHTHGAVHEHALNRTGIKDKQLIFFERWLFVRNLRSYSLCCAFFRSFLLVLQVRSSSSLMHQEPEPCPRWVQPPWCHPQTLRSCCCGGWGCVEERA